ncbi:MAG TPA: pyrroline-5-carboxylate reductase, partial [Lacipirellulaceae bacterium]|nr:pyrroline-5-carboxylate reductase [Lacipirellulaceae bacterium]
MATALAAGCVRSGLTRGEHVVASDPSETARSHFAQAVADATTTANNSAVLAACDVIVLAVKPQAMPALLAEIRDTVAPRHLLASIAAGVTLARLTDALPPGARIVRVMPNTPCLIGLGASCYSLGSTATEGDGRLVADLLASVGLTWETPESLLDAVTGLSGSGPAFVYTVIEALAAGGSALGMDDQLALELATQTTLGAAMMLRETGLSPSELRDHVTSPGGTTLAGLRALQEAG